MWLNLFDVLNFEAPSYFPVEMLFLQRYILYKHITYTAVNSYTVIPYAGHPNWRQNTAEEITFWVLNLQTLI